jgi:hypothetical protein
VREVATKDTRAMTASVYIGMIDGAGTLWNAYGRDKPERIERLPAVRAVSGECAITTDNELWCFGTMHPDQLERRLRPRPRRDRRRRSVRAERRSCVLRAQDRRRAVLWRPIASCRSTSPTRATSRSASRKRISLHRVHAARRSHGRVHRRCRRHVAYAPLRDVDYLRDVRSVAVGGGFACAVVGDGTVSCWGDNNSAGQLGDGTREAQAPCSVVGIHDAIAVSAGSTHACALHGDGTVSCLGRRDRGPASARSRRHRSKHRST